jgi:hypothetical protein
MKRYTILTALILAYTLTSGQVLAPKIISAISNHIIIQCNTLNRILEDHISEAFLQNNDQNIDRFMQTHICKMSPLPHQSEEFITSMAYPNQDISYLLVKIDTDPDWDVIQMIIHNLFGVKLDESKADQLIYESKISVHQFSSDKYLIIIPNDGKWIAKK